MIAPAGNRGDGSGRMGLRVNSIPLAPRTTTFLGTRNTRHIRALQALLKAPQPREQLDREAGCSNSPQLIAQLRQKGLELPCVREEVKDRDGFTVFRGVYCLSDTDRQSILAWSAGGCHAN